MLMLLYCNQDAHLKGSCTFIILKHTTMFFTYTCSNIEVNKHIKSVLIKLSKSIFSPGVELVHTRLTVFLPPGLRRAPRSRLITSDWLVCVCVCATVVASVCRPGFLWGQSVTFELPGAVTSWVMNAAHLQVISQTTRQTGRNKHRGASCRRSSQPETADWSLRPPRASWPHRMYL